VVGASLYWGPPRPRGGALFTGAVLVEDLDESSSYRFAIGIDLARTARTRSDFNVAVVMRLDLATTLIDVVEVVRMQGVIADKIREDEVDEGFARQLHGLQQRYPGASTVMYTGRAEDALLDLLGALDRYPCVVEGRLAVSEKHDRAQPYAAAWNEGRVRVPRGASWTNAYVTEHVGFTGLKGGRDDQVDAAAAAFDALDQDDMSLAEAMQKVRGLR
jgi:phage terminase large subunit-like protein